MLIRLEDIPDKGLQIEEAEIPSVFAGDEADWVLGPVSVFLEREGPEVVLTGSFGARVHLTCSRCLEPFTLNLTDEVVGRFAPRPPARAEEAGLSTEDLDMAFYDAESIDLAAFFRAETLLDVPMKPLCRQGCRGLCPVCGANRNLTACPCETRAADPRLAPFRVLAERVVHQEK